MTKQLHPKTGTPEDTMSAWEASVATALLDEETVMRRRFDEDGEEIFDGEDFDFDDEDEDLEGDDEDGDDDDEDEDFDDDDFQDDFTFDEDEDE